MLGVKSTVAGLTHFDWSLVQKAKELPNDDWAEVRNMAEMAETESGKEWLNSLAVRMHHNEEYANDSL